MRYILRKFIDADTVLEAIAKDHKTPIHDIYLKEGEEPKHGRGCADSIGFSTPTVDTWRQDEILGSIEKRR